MKLSRDLHLTFKNYAAFALVISLITIAVAVVGQRFLPPMLPLFYGQPEGEGQLASSLTLVIPGIMSLLLLVINSGLSLWIKDDFLKKALILTSLVVSVFALIATLKIIFLVGSF